MADKKISELTELTTPDGTEELVVNDSGVSKKITQTNLLSTALPLAGGTMTGTIAGFTSTGIDDNATSTAITIASTGGVTIAPSTTPVALNLTPNNSNCDITFASTNTSSATRLRTSINDFQIHTNGVQKVSVGSGGDVTVNTGNLVIGTSGKGIDFSADGNAAGMTSEVLDDYEEGTWTPAVSFGNASVGLTYADRTANYTKVGSLVTITAYILLSSKGTSTGQLIISGLPFSASNYTATASFFNRLSFADNPQTFINNNDTRIKYYEIANSGTVSTLLDSNCLNNTEIMISGTYQV